MRVRGRALGFEVVDGGQGAIVGGPEDAAEVTVYFPGQPGAFVDQGGVYLDRVSALGESLRYAFGAGDAAAGVDGHGIADFPSHVGHDAEGVWEKRFATETTASHFYGRFLHGAGVGGGDAVDAQFPGDADEGQTLSCSWAS